ncbi:unnamed protein product [Ascophyllum nodosum]
MSPPAAKRQRAVDHTESTRNINVVKAGLSIMCPADSMGMLIGKGGSGLRELQSNSGVKVTLQETKSMPEGAKERGVGLAGALDHVSNVQRTIFDKLNARRITALAASPAEEEYEHAYEAAKAAGLDPNNITDTDLNDPSKVTVVRWIMSNTQCGWLIGKGGSGIQNIESSSGAQVRVASEKHTSKASGERIVYIKGNADQREQALDIIRNNPKITGRVAAVNEPEIAAVQVPAKAIGYILGHRGASIQALTEKTGAQLRVAPASETLTGSSEQRVDITGTPRQVVAARHALADRVAEWRAESNPSNAPEDMEYALKIAVPQPLIGHIIGKGGVFVREILHVTAVQVKIQQDSGSPTTWGDACCVMLTGTMDNLFRGQRMIMERIANINDRLKEMVPNAVTLSPDDNPDDVVRQLEVNIQLPDGPPPVQPSFQQQSPPFDQPAYGFAPPFGQPGPSGPYAQPGQPPFQAPFQPQFPGQQPPPQQQPYRSSTRGTREDNITYNTIREMRAPGLTRAQKVPDGVLLLVENSVIGSIIGKGGQTVRKISNDTTVVIQVQGRDEVSASESERRVTLTSDDMPALLKASNMVCGVLRNNEKLRQAAAAAANGGGGGHGPGPQFNQPRGGGAPPPQQQPPALAPGNYQFQQQQPPMQQPLQFAPTAAMPYPQQAVVAPQPTQGVPPQQAYQYPQQVPVQVPPQQQPQQHQQQPFQPQAQPVPAQPGQYAPQQPQTSQQPQTHQQQAAQVYYQMQPGQAAVTNGVSQPTPQAIQYGQPGQPQQPMQQQPAPMQQQQTPPPQQQQPQQQQPPQQQQHQNQQMQVQQLPLQPQSQAQQPAAATAPVQTPAPVYGWVYDPATGTYTAAPAAPAPAPQPSSYPAQPQYSQQR